MIPSAAVKQYLARDLDDHRWVKSLEREELDEVIDSLRPRPSVSPRLRLHQRACFVLGVANPRFCFFNDMGCVDGSTEYLSPVGWRRITNYAGGSVAQYDPRTGRADFVEPDGYIALPCREMYHFKTARGCDQMLSAEHRMLVVSTGPGRGRGGKRCEWKHSPVCGSLAESGQWNYEVTPPEIIGERGRVRFETSFLMDGPGINLTRAQIRLQVAVHADGYLPNKTKACVRVKKLRKIVRMRKLLHEADVAFTERDCTPSGFKVFRFAPPLMTKTYGSGWYACSLEQRRVICDEVIHWDGGPSKSAGANFFTRSKTCADFIQFCFSSTDRRASLRTQARASGEVDYVVHVVGSGRTSNLAQLRNGRIVPAPGGMRYCFCVPSGYLVLRRNGNVFVTGNSGKSLLALELLRYWLAAGRIRRALIFVTSDKAYPSWERQFREFEIDLPHASLEGSSEDKWRTLRELGEGVALAHYPGAVAMASCRVSGRGKRKHKLALDPERVAELREWTDAVVIDESTKCGHHTSLTYKLVEAISRDSFARYALAGRPHGRDPTMLWPQYKLIDGGETLGPTLGLFRAAFFDEKKIRWDPTGRAREYKFRDSMRDELSRILQHRSIMYTADECIDLPPVVSEVVRVALPEEAGLYYDRLVEGVIAARGNLREMENVFTRMRQTSSGFVGFKDDETGDRAEVEFEENPKLDALLELVDEVPAERQVVIFYEFTRSGRLIAEALRARDESCIWLWSRTKDSRGDLAKFADGRARIAVVNNRVGAYSLDGLQVANYQFFYESPVPVIDREQAERRLVRDGQRRTVFRYDLVVEDTMDDRILEFHREGEDLFRALLRDPSTIVREARRTR